MDVHGVGFLTANHNYHRYNAIETLKVKGADMLWTVVVILVILWVLGLIGDIGGGLIHILLVAALIAFIYNMITGRRAP